MPATRPDLKRLLELAAVVATVAIPVALIIATWEPLEPEPRSGRSTAAEHERTVDASSGNPLAESDSERARDRKKKDQDAGGQSPSAGATPQP